MIRQFRKQWMKFHRGYEKKAYRIIIKHLKKHTLTIPFEKINQFNAIVFLEVNIPQEVFKDMYYDIYKEIGLIHGKRVGKYINNQINQKDFQFGAFSDTWLAEVQRMLLGQGGANITTVRKNYIDFVMELITKEFNDGKPSTEIAKALEKLIRSRNFYRWQAERIARTETTTASNYASVTASTISGVIMEKVWISAQDARTRRPPKSPYDHYDMNGKSVLLNEAFNVGGEMLQFPGDQKNGSAGNVINCRCTVAQRVKRDKNGNIIRVNNRGAVLYA